MLQNEYLFAKVGVDAAENEPPKVSIELGVPTKSRTSQVSKSVVTKSEVKQAKQLFCI